MSSVHRLPNTGYIAMQEMCEKIQEMARQVNISILADDDTGYDSTVNVRRTVESFAKSGPARVIIEDQAWPKRCGHIKGKSAGSREDAYARIQAAHDARDQSQDIFILARIDAIFVEALLDRNAMKMCMAEIDMPMLTNELIYVGLADRLKGIRDALGPSGGGLRLDRRV
uniref:Carboxyvinyl-carboxyphosphonate phosphorylmutase n=1 Tax=Talaromyces marneffei PM1 TaxID=1077442 RepID=A0A093W181_TALMA